MADLDPAGTDWTDLEIDLVVADYFDMLRLERAGEPFVKAHRNAALQRFVGRSRGSIEFKHQNISAVLLKLGSDWIRGYKPMANYQAALVDGVGRFLSAEPGILSLETAPTDPGISEPATLYFEAAPTISEVIVNTPSLERLVRKFDPAARDARNRKLGRAGEEQVFNSELLRLRTEGRPDLASRVRWVSAEDGDGAGYDIRSFDQYGRERFLEVKTTSGHQTTPFYLSENERLLSEERPEEFRLVRLYGFGREPRAFELVPPLAASVLLQPTEHRASFGD